MFIYCEICNYDSGDLESTDALVEKLREDGGEASRDEVGMLVLACPHGHSGEAIHLD